MSLIQTNYNTNNLPKRGDTVSIIGGAFRGRTGRVYRRKELSFGIFVNIIILNQPVIIKRRIKNKPQIAVLTRQIYKIEL